MKALYMLLIILFCSTPLHAEVSILTELEQVQEKLWQLNRDTGAYKASLEAQKKQLGLLASSGAKERLELNDRLTALTQEVNNQRERAGRLESGLEQLGQSLTALATEAKQQNSSLLDQSGKIDALEGSFKALQAALAARETDTKQLLTDLRTQLAESRAQMAEARAQTAETRAQLETLGQDVGGRVEQIGYWGAGAALVLAIALVVGILIRKS